MQTSIVKSKLLRSNEPQVNIIDYLGGFGLVHPVNSGNNSKNARIVKWDSVA